MEQQQEAIIQTWCKDCIFAQYDSNNKQNNCKLNRLELLVDNGAKLDMREEEGKTFYIIKERFCLACRNEEWAEKNDRKNAATIVRAQMTTRCDAIVLFDYKTLKELKVTLNSLAKQELPPVKVVVILNQNNIKPIRIIKELENQPYEWQIVQIMNRDLSREGCVDKGIEKSTAPWYAVFEPGYEVPFTFFSDIDKSINDRLERFCILTPSDESDWNCLVVQKNLHKSLGGNEPMEFEEDGNIYYTLKDKVCALAERENATHMIKCVKDVCNV